MGNLLYPPLNFAVNLKTTPKNQALKKKKNLPHSTFPVSDFLLRFTLISNYSSCSNREM